MSHYAAWIEPTLLNEWIELMQSYEGSARRTHDEHLALLRWLDPVHDTHLVRDLAENIREHNTALYCVWSKRRLKDGFAIDHCLPFAAWPCNDLWNLLPTHPNVNQKKADKLPSTESLVDARELILDWWQMAYLEQGVFSERFKDEATAVLPGTLASSTPLSPEDVFDGMMLQRAVLKRDQQLVEWTCC